MAALHSAEDGLHWLHDHTPGVLTAEHAVEEGLDWLKHHNPLDVIDPHHLIHDDHHDDHHDDRHHDGHHYDDRHHDGNLTPLDGTPRRDDDLERLSAAARIRSAARRSKSPSARRTRPGWATASRSSPSSPRAPLWCGGDRTAETRHRVKVAIGRTVNQTVPT